MNRTDTLLARKYKLELMFINNTNLNKAIRIQNLLNKIAYEKL